MNITNNVVAFKDACVQINSFPRVSAAGKRTYVFLSSGSRASWLVILAMSASTSSKRSDTCQAALGDLEEAVVVVRQTMRGVPDGVGAWSQHERLHLFDQTAQLPSEYTGKQP